MLYCDIIVEICIPKKLQLARTNVKFEVFIANTTKLDVLRFICIPKPEFGTLVETSCYMGYIP